MKLFRDIHTWGPLLLAKITFWQVCYSVHLSVCLFVTCQNYHFGKYVGWSCLLLLAKIYILSVCLLTCQNYHFGKYVRWSCLLLVTCQNLHFGKYVRWSCLSVCLSVCLFVWLYGNFTKSQEDSVNDHQTWSQASTSPWFLQVRWTRM